MSGCKVGIGGATIIEFGRNRQHPSKLCVDSCRSVIPSAHSSSYKLPLVIRPYKDVYCQGRVTLSTISKLQVCKVLVPSEMGWPIRGSHIMGTTNIEWYKCGYPFNSIPILTTAHAFGSSLAEPNVAMERRYRAGHAFQS